MSLTHVEQIATWCAELRAENIPARIVELSGAQTLAVHAGVAASADDDAAARICEAIDDPLYQGAVRSMALDFDDYLSFGHTGHSAVLVADIIGDEAGADDATRLCAQTVANEVGARLGGACLVGPLNGQLWSFIHAAGAAVCAAKLFGLDATRTAHALALALTNAPHPTVPGFMAPDSKLVTAAEPITTGVRAARLAASGVTGPLDVLDHPKGFFSAFSDVALRGLLGGLGDGWAMHTLCVKPYPGCAYIDTTIDALGEILAETGPLDPGEIESITIDAGVLTCEMDALSSQYAQAHPTPVTVTFSIPWNVAITVVAGKLTPDEVNSAWLDKHSVDLDAVRNLVTLNHDIDATLRSAKSFAQLLPLGALAREAGMRRWLGAIRGASRRHAGLRFRAPEIASLAKQIATGELPSMRGPRGYWDPEALERFAMTFPSSVEVRMRDGSRLTAAVEVPRGAAGHGEFGPVEAACAKARLVGIPVPALT